MVYLRYANAAELVPVLDAMLQTGSNGEGEGAQSSSSIQAHEATNALVITAPAATMEALHSVIRQLDIRRAQVLIEAVIAEVAEETAKEFGIQWQTVPEDGGALGRGVIGGTNFTGPAGGNILGTITGGVEGLAGLPGGLNLGWWSWYRARPRRRADPDPQHRRPGAGPAGRYRHQCPVDAVDRHPGQPGALIEVGQEVPFIQGEFTTPVTSGGVGGANGMVNPFRTLERKSIGLKLKVTPQINEGDAVVLTLEQEVSSLAPNVQGAVDLITNQRILKTTVLVGDGQLLVLGGLVTEDQNERVNKVRLKYPVLATCSSTAARPGAAQPDGLPAPGDPVDAGESAISGSKYNLHPR